MGFREDVSAALGGDATALEKPKRKTPRDIVGAMSAKKRAAFRSLIEEYLAALDEFEVADEVGPPDEDEEEA